MESLTSRANGHGEHSRLKAPGSTPRHRYSSTRYMAFAGNVTVNLPSAATAWTAVSVHIPWPYAFRPPLAGRP